MRIPFSAPRLPELDKLPVEQRRRVMMLFVESGHARKLVWCVRASILVASALVAIALNWSGAGRVVCSVAALLSLLLGLVYYRRGAARAIRAILDSQEDGN
jgi:hypothetical protein